MALLKFSVTGSTAEACFTTNRVLHLLSWPLNLSMEGRYRVQCSVITYGIPVNNL